MRSLEYDIGFSDSELIGYHREGDSLIVVLRAWNEQELVFTFLRVALFIDRGAADIADVICEDHDTAFMREALRRLYEKMPLKHDLKHYSFIDLDDQPCIEIIAESFSIITKS